MEVIVEVGGANDIIGGATENVCASDVIVEGIDDCGGAVATAAGRDKEPGIKPAASGVGIGGGIFVGGNVEMLTPADVLFRVLEDADNNIPGDSRPPAFTGLVGAGRPPVNTRFMSSPLHWNTWENKYEQLMHDNTKIFDLVFNYLNITLLFPKHHIPMMFLLSAHECRLL